ncbi:DUF4249 family protein [Flavivirga jejuensis]|uniref:DUF4249 family protein n=1 Tax=Flavivirga jejuensis TaxID=870487 RepID=A0ABT8WNW0_9FLAO|nr:DUF4249 family protein [Flavivirga jejuensis]MDO5974841.1 DUF4249 family protein [Flavivirga jejuensis]
MKKLIYIVVIGLYMTSCEDVIDVDLKTAEPRLVIDASLNWFNETLGKKQLIQLTLTAPYFNSNIPPASGATVTVTDLNNNIFNFIEEENTGIYINNTFIPVINGTYNLTISYNNEIYTATERLIPVVPIDFVEQKDNGGFSGEETEIKAYYTDPENIKNYYLFEFSIFDSNSLNLEVYDDEFTDGNQIFGFYSNEDLSAGDQLIIRNSGISKRFFEYLNILLQQSDTDPGTPFETQPATVRGNCINQTNPENYPLGYFKVSEVSVFTYTIK